MRRRSRVAPRVSPTAALVAQRPRCALDILEADGEDIRREPNEDRRHRRVGRLWLTDDGIALDTRARRRIEATRLLHIAPADQRIGREPRTQ